MNQVDGTLDFRRTYTYDSNGNLTMEEYDYKADGTADKRNTYTYDSNGNLTMEEYDKDADGTVDERNTYTYQAVGGWAYIIESIMLNRLLEKQ
jgi:serralysin